MDSDQECGGVVLSSGLWSTHSGLTVLALHLSLRVWGSEAKLCVYHCVCKQASVCSSVKWDSITCPSPFLWLQSVARA